MSSVSTILAAFPAIRQVGNGGRYIAKCPAHKDDTPSLSLRVTEDKVLVHCFAGCDTQRILSSVGLSYSDLFMANTTTDKLNLSYMYNAFLEYLDLLPEHTKLLRTKYGVKEAKEWGYRSLTWLKVTSAVRELYRRWGEALYAVPGFVRGCNGEPKATHFSGLWIPVRDCYGNIIRGLIRTGNPNRKYVWFQAGGGPVPAAHWRRISSNGLKSSLIVEGPVKADSVASQQPDWDVILGASGANKLAAAAEEAVAAGIKRIDLAPDADWKTSSPVAASLKAAVSKCLSLGVETNIITWDGAKGPDDYLLSGGRLLPTSVTRDTLSVLVGGPPKIKLTRADDIPPTAQVEWLWKDWLPAGSLIFIEGDPGVGKTYFVCDLLARLTTGKCFLDGQPPSSNKSFRAVYCSAEDSPVVLAKRLRTAGADLSSVWFGPSFDFDLTEKGVLQDLLIDYNPKVVVFDPLSAYLGSVDGYRDQSVRTILTPMADLARNYQVSIICIRHLRKAGGIDLYRGIGSIGLTAAARTVISVVRRSKDVLIRVVKSNYSTTEQSLVCRLENERLVAVNS